MAIDVWMQQPTDRLLQSPFITSLHKSIPSIPRTDFSVEEVIQVLDEANVQSALLSALGPQGPLISNEEVNAWTRQHPHRFFGIAGVDLRHPMQAIQTLRKYVHDCGFKGLRVIQWLWERPCTDALYYPLFAECVQLNIPVCLLWVLRVRWRHRKPAALCMSNAWPWTFPICKSCAGISDIHGNKR